jgi:hypothetical protein
MLFWKSVFFYVGMKRGTERSLNFYFELNPIAVLSVAFVYPCPLYQRLNWVVQ